MSKTRLYAIRGDATDEANGCRVLQELRATPEIFAAIAAGPADELALQRALRGSYADELVRAALLQMELRARAVSKFSRAADMWFDRVGLEQATSEVVARHKAVRFSGPVDDLCSGIGGDALALAARSTVRAVDRRASLGLMARWNAEVYGVDRQLTTVVGDAAGFLSGAELVHLDPDRRVGQGRSIRIEDYQPGLEAMRSLQESRPGGAIKLSPASNFGGKFPDCEIELVSLNGECKEAIVWFGSLAGVDDWRATALPSGETISGDPLSEAAGLSAVGPLVFDPDPAVVRSGLLDVVASRFGLNRLDDAEEYLTGDEPVASTFVTAFEVVADLPFNEKLVRRYFREQEFGQVEIKCRHVRVDAEAYRRRLSLRGVSPVTLIIARVGGRTRVLVCRRCGRAVV